MEIFNIIKLSIVVFLPLLITAKNTTDNQTSFEKIFLNHKDLNDDLDFFASGEMVNIKDKLINYF